MLRRSDYSVGPVALSTAREFIVKHHYSGSASNTAVAVHGLFDTFDRLVGVAQWIPPTKGAALATYPEGDFRRVLALSRLAIAPDVPQNGASFLLGRSERLVRATRAWDCLVTYADTGEGHTGAIYRATNWQYLGLTKPEYRWVDAEGRMVSRLSTKSRTVEQMHDLGYRRIGPFVKHKYRKVLIPRAA